VLLPGWRWKPRYTVRAMDPVLYGPGEGEHHDAGPAQIFIKATGEQKGAVFMDKVQTGATMTYMHNGKQYLVCAQGGSFGADLVAYALPGEAPAAPRPEER